LLSDTSVQSTTELYEYPCKKFPPSIRNRKNPPAPTADEVCTYLEEFIQEKNMASKFRFNTVVSDVLCTSESNWIVEYDGLKTRRFTFVIVCNGLVSSKPNFPILEGAETFKNNGGVIIHSSERREDLNLEGKRVLVIGNGKSAVDAAWAAAEAAQASGGLPPIQLARRQTWYVPRYILGILQYKWAFHTRIGSTLLPRYYETTHPFLKLLHAVFSPIKWILWRVVELLLLAQYRLPMRLWPKLGTVVNASLETSALITDEPHLRLLRNGSIDMRIGTVRRLEAHKAILSDGREEPVDIIILGTGWNLSYDQFMSSGSIFSGMDFDKDALKIESDGLWLYRNILPVGFKGMAFVGANTLTFMNIYTSYVQAYWLAQLLAGKRPWPEEAHMKDTIQREKDHKRKYYRNGEMRAASVECYMQHYHDVLFREMKARKPFNCLIRPIADLLVPVLPCTMKGCLEPLYTDSVNGAANGVTEDCNSSFTNDRSASVNFEVEKGGAKTVVEV
jgi:dimethylaniline monooxygenase (N-oxide forming)